MNKRGGRKKGDTNGQKLPVQVRTCTELVARTPSPSRWGYAASVVRTATQERTVTKEPSNQTPGGGTSACTMCQPPPLRRSMGPSLRAPRRRKYGYHRRTMRVLRVVTWGKRWSVTPVRSYVVRRSVRPAHKSLTKRLVYAAANRRLPQSPLPQGSQQNRSSPPDCSGGRKIKP